MLLQRTLVILVLLPIGLVTMYLGGPVFFVFVSLLLGIACWEYARLFRASGHQPAAWLVIGGGLAILLGRALDGFASTPLILTSIILVSTVYFLLAYENGRSQAATDFAITIGGALYIGWLGAYMISLRELNHGFWWLLLVLVGVWAGDTGAYFIGTHLGRHKFSPRLSPKKTWEGYFGGIASAVLLGALFGYLWELRGGPEPGLTPLSGAIVGLALSLLTPLGDLGESMIKRQAGLKDSGKIFPGHGGAFDRVDSWLWAAPIGYYLILWWFL
jgi:phosphatidate cytidylyltransferase